MTSFISEHTAEYILVPDLVRRLMPEFPDIVPLFFWASREGNTTAQWSMEGVPVRIVTAFPRRPKILPDRSNRILMKLNGQLFNYASESSGRGIPVIAGVPLVTSLPTLRLNARCCWFEIPIIASYPNSLSITSYSDTSSAGPVG